MPCSKVPPGRPKPINYKTRANAALRRYVFERDGHACVTCGWKPGDPHPIAKHGKYKGQEVYRVLEIDHIIPRLHGGTHDESNLQTLCTGCNARKGGRMPGKESA